MAGMTTQRRPGGRTARVRVAVHEAVIALLQESTWDELTIAKVAERSEVHQATIYRRWGSVTGLVDDVVMELLRRTSPIPDTGTLRGDLEAYAVQLARDIAAPTGRLFLRAAMVGSGNAEDRIYLIERGVQLQAMLDRAKERGEHPPALIELMEIVQAPVYFHAMFFNAPMGPDQAKALVDRLLRLGGRPS